MSPVLLTMLTIDPTLIFIFHYIFDFKYESLVIITIISAYIIVVLFYNAGQ